MRILVTGAAGFIGQHLVRKLLSSRLVTSVVGLDIATYKGPEMSNSRFTSCSGDVRDLHLLTDITAEVDAVIHLAALASVPESIRHPLRTHDVNSTGTLHVLEAARRTKTTHVTVASSSAVYGEHPTQKKHEALPVSYLSPYAASKGATEGHAHAYYSAYGMKTLAFRFFNVFGPGQLANHAYAAVIPRFLEAIRAGRPLEVYGNGDQSRDFVSVHTVVDVLAKSCINEITASRAVNLASGISVSINDLISELATIHDANLDVVYLPEREGDIRHSGADISRLRTLVPDFAESTLPKALAEVYAWYLESDHSDFSQVDTTTGRSNI